MDDSDGSIGLYLFTVDASLARRAEQAGVMAAVVDWESKGKEGRQLGADTEVNCDTANDLFELSGIAGLKRCCRINGFGASTAEEVERAIHNGAGELLLPMVEAVSDVEAYLRMIDGRVGAGILVETVAACELADELASLNLDLVYVGLHDLSLQRKDPRLFMPLLDGTIDRLRESFGETRFGFGGLTVLEGGSPIPCRVLLSEMARLGCDFSFLRRSFKREIVDLDLEVEVNRLQQACQALRRRSVADAERDRLVSHDVLRREYGLAVG